jgi:antitoxin YefM
VTQRDGKALVIMSEKEWRRERETLYVLQNSDLMKQIAASALTYKQGTGDTASMPFCNT